MTTAVPEPLAASWDALRLSGTPMAAQVTKSATARTSPAERTPEWWIDRLYGALARRAPAVRLFDDYYIGDHPLPWVAEQAREEFRRIVRMTRSNYMGLVVDSMVERMNVEGFRVEGDADDQLWRIWQANNLDSESDQAWLEAAKSGQAYGLAGPNADNPAQPHMTVEHPLQAIVEHAPGNRRTRAAGSKIWVDEWTSDLHAELYLPAGKGEASGWLVTFSAKHTPGTDPKWRRSADPVKTGVKMVPLVELPNNPRLLVGGVSELADLIDIQDRINKTIFDRLQGQEFGVDPQKWAIGFPDKDEDGNDNVVEFGRNRMVTTNVAQTKFGNFEVAPLDPMSMAKREDVKDVASRSRTPAQYLLGEMSNVNGETLKASESGLVSKVRQRQRGHDAGLEDWMSIGAIFAGLTTNPYVRMETIWRNPQYRTEGEVTDAAIKRNQEGIVPLRQTREDLGYSAEQISRMEQADQLERRDPYLDRLDAKDANGADSGAAGNGN